MKMFLRSCGPKCAKVRMLPVFDLTQVIPLLLKPYYCHHDALTLPTVLHKLQLYADASIFDLLKLQARYDAHHGNFGRGKDTWVLDCRHFCSPVVDVWNQVFFNLLC